MILGFTTVAAIVAGAAALLGIGLGLAGRRPSDVSLAGPAVVELLLLAQLVIAIVAPFAGNRPTGSIRRVLRLPDLRARCCRSAAMVWALMERTRWCMVVVGVVCARRGRDVLADADDLDDPIGRLSRAASPCDVRRMDPP